MHLRDHAGEAIADEIPPEPNPAEREGMTWAMGVEPHRGDSSTALMPFPVVKSVTHVTSSLGNVST
jgi:hypothetical protein